ncbi:unnamed protein product [Orchesella dallaii]|uniref:C2H2-type domain-containing protein n=1 Tax=Orchesella dallaii TaxID=48710 RepID=A0ABP1S4B9_9HEXA
MSSLQQNFEHGLISSEDMIHAVCMICHDRFSTQKPTKFNTSNFAKVQRGKRLKKICDLLGFNSDKIPEMCDPQTFPNCGDCEILINSVLKKQALRDKCQKEFLDADQAYKNCESTLKQKITESETSSRLSSFVENYSTPNDLVTFMDTPENADDIRYYPSPSSSAIGSVVDSLITEYSIENPEPINFNAVDPLNPENEMDIHLFGDITTGSELDESAPIIARVDFSDRSYDANNTQFAGFKCPAIPKFCKKSTGTNKTHSPAMGAQRLQSDDRHVVVQGRALRMNTSVLSNCMAPNDGCGDSQAFLTAAQNRNFQKASRKRVPVPGFRIDECNICRKIFPNKQSLLEHKSIHSTNLWTFQNHENASINQDEQEENIRKLPSNKAKKGKKNGKRRTGKAERKKLASTFRCEVCEKGFARKNHLTNHKKVHIARNPTPEVAEVYLPEVVVPESFMRNDDDNISTVSSIPSIHKLRLRNKVLKKPTWQCNSTKHSKLSVKKIL